MITITTTKGNQSSFKLGEPKPIVANKVIRLEASGEELTEMKSRFANLVYPKQEGRKPEERKVVWTGEQANFLWQNM
jgi:hypothetical protein